MYLQLYVPIQTYGYEIGVMTKIMKSWTEGAYMSFLHRLERHSLRDGASDSTNSRDFTTLGRFFRWVPQAVLQEHPTKRRPRTSWGDVVSIGHGAPPASPRGEAELGRGRDGERISVLRLLAPQARIRG